MGMFTTCATGKQHFGIGTQRDPTDVMYYTVYVIRNITFVGRRSTNHGVSAA